MLRSPYRLLALVTAVLLLCTGCQIRIGFPDAQTTVQASTAPSATQSDPVAAPSVSDRAPDTLPLSTTTATPVSDPQTTDAPATEEPITPKKRVAFTFDDGPHATFTYKFVDKLKEYGATATFFIVGNNVTKARGAAMAYAAENGCEIGIHSYTHTNALYYDRCTDAEYLQDMQQTADAINAYVPAPVTLMRPPGGNITAERVASCPYSVILWNVDSEDWRYKGRTTPEETKANINVIVENVMRTISDGDIVLMHELYENSYEAFCIIIERLYNEGYEIVSVTELLGDSLQPGKKYSHG